MSISGLKAHFSPELGPVIEPRDKSLKINRFALTGSAYYSVLLLVQHFSFHCESRTGRKVLVFVHIKLHNRCAACKWLAPIVLAVSDIFVKDIKLKQLKEGHPVAAGEAVDYMAFCVC